jgi:hypothetical protein
MLITKMLESQTDTDLFDNMSVLTINLIIHRNNKPTFLLKIGANKDLSIAIDNYNSRIESGNDNEDGNF